MKKFLLLLKVFVSLFFFYWLFQKININVAYDTLAKVNLLGFLIATFLCLIVYLLSALRWWTILSAFNSNIKIYEAISLTFIGQFFNQILVSSIGGDVVRSYYVYKNGTPLSSSFTSVLLERYFSLVVLGTLMPVILLFISDKNIESQLIHIAIGLSIALLSSLTVLLTADSIPILNRHPRIGKILRVLCRDARTLFFSVKNVVILYVYSVTIWILTIGVAYCVSSFSGWNISFLGLFFALSMAIFASFIPISIGGWGVREGTLIVLLAPFNVPAESALCVSLWFGIALLVATLPGSIFWIMRPHIDAKDIQRMQTWNT